MDSGLAERLLMAMGLCLLGPVGCGSDDLVAAASPPHILMIVADDLGWNDVGYHGSEIPTPRIDGLAAAGVRAEHFYVAPQCSATRAALLTGRYPVRYGIRGRAIGPGSEAGLDLAERTLARALQDEGYFTALVGKWHLGMGSHEQLPRSRGFDHHYGLYGGMIDYFEHTRLGGLDWHRNGQPVREPGYATDLLADEAVRLVESRDPARPLFLMLAFNAPHEPLQPRPADVQTYAAIPGSRRRLYAAVVARMDHAIGRVLDALTAAGMLDQTLVLFLSDNGGNVSRGASNDPLRGGKGGLGEGGLRVPALWVWPGVLAAGTRVASPMHAVDVAPTLLAAVGVAEAAPAPLDGVNLLPVLAGGAAADRDLLLNLGPPSALRAGRFKLRVSGSVAAPKQVSLYDLATDPEESRDLAEQEPDRVADLLERLQRFKGIAAARRPLAEKQPSDARVPAVWGPPSR